MDLMSALVLLALLDLTVQLLAPVLVTVSAMMVLVVMVPAIVLLDFMAPHAPTPARRDVVVSVTGLVSVAANVRPGSMEPLAAPPVVVTKLVTSLEHANASLDVGMMPMDVTSCVEPVVLILPVTPTTDNALVLPASLVPTSANTTVPTLFPV